MINRGRAAHSRQFWSGGNLDFTEALLLLGLAAGATLLHIW